MEDEKQTMEMEKEEEPIKPALEQKPVELVKEVEGSSISGDLSFLSKKRPTLFQWASTLLFTLAIAMEFYLQFSGYQTALLAQNITVNTTPLSGGNLISSPPSSFVFAMVLCSIFLAISVGYIIWLAWRQLR